MKAKTIILLALALVAVLATSCKSEEEVERLDLTEAQIQSIPYEKGQVVRFINGAGQVVNFTVIKSKLSWSQEDEVMYRVRSASLESESDNFRINLGISGSNHYSTSLDIQIRRGTNMDWNWMHFLSVDVEGNFRISTYGYTSTSFHESLEINGKVYYDVIEQKSEYEGTYLRRIPIQLFYNKTYGVLQANREGQNVLTIVPDEGKGNNSIDAIDCFDAPLAERNVK